MAVLYRKYRPTKLEDVVGQEQVTTVLQGSLKQGKIAHAYLFIGPRGTGKTSVARIFAHAVNDFNYQIEDSYLDIIEIDAASNTGVDNIRELREKAIIAPTKGKYKVYIIDEVHMLTKSASNALLKTLEEPPEHVIFIMATTDAYKVPITISSRTQVHTFKLANPETMQKHLRKIADQEGIKIDDDALALVVRRGSGSFRDSLSLLDQIASLSDQQITAAQLEQALGLPQAQALGDLLRAYKSQNQAQLHATLQDLINIGIKPEVIASELINLIMAQPETELLPLLAKLPEVGPPFADAKLLLACLKMPQTSPKTPQSFQASVKSTPQPPQSAPPAQPTLPTPPVQPTKTNTGDFSWDNFLATMHEESLGIYNQLAKSSYKLEGNTLHIYPERDFAKVILEKPGNRQVMSAHLAGLSCVIHSADERPVTPENPQFDQISAIMGGVQEVSSDAPF